VLPIQKQSLEQVFVLKNAQKLKMVKLLLNACQALCYVSTNNINILQLTLLDSVFQQAKKI